MLKKLSVITLALITTNSYAIMCPNNFNQINVGDSISAVTTQCGKPASEKHYKIEANVPQEWGYYVPINPPTPTTMEMSIVFTDNKVMNITVNATSLVSTSLCGGTVNIGDSMDAVKSVCGKPTFITKGQLNGAAPETEVDELKYNGQTPNTLLFENGKLKARQ